MRAKKPTDDERRQAWTCLHNSYRYDVDDIVDTMLESVASGEVQTIEAFDLRLDEECGNSPRTICTGKAIECLLMSENEDAYCDENGTDMPDGVDTIPWSTLAFYAFRTDVYEMLESWTEGLEELFHNGPDIPSVAKSILDSFSGERKSP